MRNAMENLRNASYRRERGKWKIRNAPCNREMVGIKLNLPPAGVKWVRMVFKLDITEMVCPSIVKLPYIGNYSSSVFCKRSITFNGKQGLLFNDDSYND